MRNNKVLRLTLSALFLALGILLPFLTGNNRQLGNIFSLMHIPVLLCGFVCGWKHGLFIGFVTPLLRSLLIGMPPMLPVALGMAFELAAYGAAAGLLYRLLGKKTLSIYISLIAAMLIGRVVFGLAMALLLGINGGSYTLQAFLAGAFINAWPGIILHILIIPPIVLAIEKVK